ncbi:hypothetical protein, partial [Pediococcus acidilactici]|uniref:hypothetical protein n=1 Tax=Pediococcus acidilactici TaxID=1254 RepID=UPI001D032A46
MMEQERVQIYSNGQIQFTNPNDNGLEFVVDIINKQVIPAIKLFDGMVYVKFEGGASVTLEFYINVEDKAIPGKVSIICASFKFEFEPDKIPPTAVVTPFPDRVKEDIRYALEKVKQNIPDIPDVAYAIVIVGAVLSAGWFFF